MSTTEDELRADLVLATRALERLRSQNAELVAQRHQLAADLVYAEQGVSTWTEAAIKRRQERDAAVGALADVQLKFEAATQSYHEELRKREHADGLFAASRAEVDQLKNDLATARMSVPRLAALIAPPADAQPGAAVSIFDVIEIQHGRVAREDALKQTIEYLRAHGEHLAPAFLEAERLVDLAGKAINHRCLCGWIEPIDVTRCGNAAHHDKAIAAYRYQIEQRDRCARERDEAHHRLNDADGALQDAGVAVVDERFDVAIQKLHAARDEARAEVARLHRAFGVRVDRLETALRTAITATDPDQSPSPWSNRELVVVFRAALAADEHTATIWPLPSVRRVVLRFAIEMERTLRANDYKGGWEDEDGDGLLDTLHVEVDELDRAVSAKLEHNDAVRQEAVDVANFAMMIADKSERMGKKLPADLQADLDAVLGRKGA